MTRFILVRHGETMENASRLCQGQGEGRLSEKGHRENHRLARQLRGQAIDRCYSSPLSRARETARVILSYHALELRTDPRLTERDMGSLTGKPFPEDYSLDKAYLYMENLDELAQRLRAFLRDILSPHPGKCTLLVSHGISIMVMKQLLCGQPGAPFVLENMPANSSATFIDLDDSIRV